MFASSGAGWKRRKRFDFHGRRVNGTNDMSDEGSSESGKDNKSKEYDCGEDMKG
ncbi:MAG: hypothetical protein ACOX8W_03690 [bacterium]|jgi:hypothetical protein